MAATRPENGPSLLDCREEVFVVAKATSHIVRDDIQSCADGAESTGVLQASVGKKFCVDAFVALPCYLHAAIKAVDPIKVTVIVGGALLKGAFFLGRRGWKELLRKVQSGLTGGFLGVHAIAVKGVAGLRPLVECVAGSKCSFRTAELAGVGVCCNAGRNCGAGKADLHRRIAFVELSDTAKGAGNRCDGQAPVVCGNAAGAGCGSAPGHTDRGQVYLQAAHFSLPVGLGRAAVTSLCAPFSAGMVHA